MGLKSKLIEVLEDTKCGERRIHAFLKQHSALIEMVFCNEWNFHHVFHEFALGREKRIDVLLLSAHSNSWFVRMIELKSPQVQLYNSKGVKDKDLLKAELQLAERREWIESNEAYFRTLLSQKLKPEDAPAFCSSANDHLSAHSEILDPKVPIHYSFHSVIGRSKNLSDEERTLRRLDKQSGGFDWREVVTFDRFIEAAELIDLRKI